MKEKRRHPRHPYSKPVPYKDKEKIPETGSMGSDISKSGVRIRVGEFLPIAKEIDLKLHLDNPTRVLDVKGHVMWVREVPYSDFYEVGIRFSHTQENIT